jgi:hypothetical protein
VQILQLKENFRLPFTVKDFRTLEKKNSLQMIKRLLAVYPEYINILLLERDLHNF